MRTAPARAGLYLLMLGAIAACSRSETPATQVIVSLNSDLHVGSQLTRIQAELFDAEGDSAPVESRSFVLTDGMPRDGEARLPLSFGIREGRAERFRLVITGYGVRGTNAPEEPVVEQKVVASFQERQTLLLKLFLGQSCFANLCDGSTTCYSELEQGIGVGECGPIPIRTDLPRVEVGDEDDAWTDGFDDGSDHDAESDGSALDGATPGDGNTAGGLDASSSPDGSTDAAADSMMADGGLDGAPALGTDGAVGSEAGPTSEAGADSSSDAAPDGAGACPAGYVFQDGCADINECAVDNGGCGQRCTNKNGGYTCSCGSGYKLGADARACDLFVWGAVNPLDRTDDDAFSASIAVDQYGHAIVVWDQRHADTYSVWSSSYDGATWSEPAVLSAGVSASGAFIAMNALGEAVAVWQQNSGDGSYDLWARRYLIGQRWLPAVQLDTTASQVQGPTAVVDAQGNITVAWTRVTGSGGALWTSRFDVATGAWSAAGALSSAAGTTAVTPGPPRLAVDAAGIVWVAWAQTVSNNSLLWVSRYVPGTGWTAGSTVASSGGASGLPTIVLQSSGEGLITWNRVEQSTQSIYWTNCSSGLACSAGILLASNSSDASLVLDTQGVISAAWGSTNGPMWARKSPGQGWLQAQPVVSGRSGAMSPSLLIDGSNNLMALWPERAGEGVGSLWYSRFVPGGAWSTARLLQAEAAPCDGVSAGIDAAGNVTAVWGQYDGARYNVLARRLQ